MRFACRRYGGVAESCLSFTAGFLAGVAHVYRLIIISSHRVDPCMIYWVTAFLELISLSSSSRGNVHLLFVRKDVGHRIFGRMKAGCGPQ